MRYPKSGYSLDVTPDGHFASEADYIAAVEAHLQDAGWYEDDLLPIQAADLDFLRGFYALCHAGFIRQKPIEEIGFFARTAVEDYGRLGRESALIFLQESVRITLTGTLLTEYRSDVFTLKRSVPSHILDNARGAGRPMSGHPQPNREPAPVERQERRPQLRVERSSGKIVPFKRLRGIFSASIIGSFVGASLLVPLIAVTQLAAVNEGLMSWGVPWWLAMLLAPPLGFIPVVGTIIGSIGATGWGLHPILAVILLLLPGRRQLMLYVLSRRRGTG